MKTLVRIREAGETLYSVELYIIKGKEKHLSFQIYVDMVEIELKIIEQIIDHLAKQSLMKLIKTTENTKRGCNDGKNLN